MVIPWHRVWHRVAALKSRNSGKRPLIIRNGNLIRVHKGNFEGVWRVFSAKNNASGIALDMGRADVVRLQNKTEGHKINVLLASLFKSGLEVLPNGLLGVPNSDAR